LKQVKEETTQKRKLKQYLVLASRLLFLFFLIMAFAQPFLPAVEQIGAGKNKVIYLDNSFSMSVPAGEKLRTLDAAIMMTQQLSEVFPPDTRYRLITNDFAPFSNSYKTKSELQDLLAQVRLSPISRKADEIQARMAGLQDEVYWLSDFQKSTWGGSETSFDSSRQWHLVPIQVPDAANVFVDSLYLENPFVVGGERNAIRVKLRNNGAARIGGLVVKLTINGTQSATVSANLEPNSISEISFDLSAGLSGMNRGMISFNDFPVSFDNEFYFTINFTRQVRVVEIKAGTESTYVERVFGNRQLFQFRSFTSSNIDYGAIGQADFLVLSGINRLEPSLGVALQTYRQSGGNILLIPGSKPDINSYAQTLQVPVLKWNESGNLEPLDRPDYANPLFENIFEEKSTQLAMPSATKLLDWGADASAILKFRDGRPFLSNYRNLYLMASPLTKEATDFYSHALFVPVMYRLAAMGRKSESKPYYFMTASTLVLKADSLSGEEPVRLVGAQEIIPPQRKEVDGIVMDLPRFSMNAGFYRAMFRKDTLDELAFNMERAESILERFSEKELAEQYKNRHVSILTTTSAAAFGKEIKDRYLGTPLWKHALLLSLLFLLAEVLLIRFWK
jgi:hypothetical protein